MARSTTRSGGGGQGEPNRHTWPAGLALLITVIVAAIATQTPVWAAATPHQHRTGYIGLAVVWLVLAAAFALIDRSLTGRKQSRQQSRQRGGRGYTSNR
jgi:hypothetical protein